MSEGAGKRPLSVGDIIELAFAIWWRNGLTLFSIVVVVTGPIQILTNLVQAAVFPDWYFRSPSESPLATDAEPELRLGDISTLVGAMLLAFVLAAVGYAIVQAASFKAVVDAYRGEQPGWGDSLGFAVRRAHSVLWVTFLVTILMLFAFLLLVVPGIWLAISWAFAIPALLVEDVRGRRALGRSFQLVRGRWWRTFGVLLIAFLVTVFVAAVVALPFERGVPLAFPDDRVATFVGVVVGGTIANAITIPLLTAFLAVVYFDLRAGKEGS